MAFFQWRRSEPNLCNKLTRSEWIFYIFFSLTIGHSITFFRRISAKKKKTIVKRAHVSENLNQVKMCGGWACASYNIACCNPRLSTLRFSGRCFAPTPCGPCDKCYVLDTSRKKNTNNCYVPHILSPLDAQLCTLASTQKKKEDE